MSLAFIEHDSETEGSDDLYCPTPTSQHKDWLKRKEKGMLKNDSQMSTHARYYDLSFYAGSIFATFETNEPFQRGLSTPASSRNLGNLYPEMKN